MSLKNIWVVKNNNLKYNKEYVMFQSTWFTEKKSQQVCETSFV